jgi:ADP-ribosylglycohydrolase
MGNGKLPTMRIEPGDRPINLSLEKITGCLLGGAIGDALGASIEFMSIAEIREKYGPKGVTNYVEHPDGKGEFTDDTQMTLFTAEGLLRAKHRAVIKGISGAQTAITFNAYLRWLITQNEAAPTTPISTRENYDPIRSGWLLNEPALYKRRAPGNTCLSALESGQAGSFNLPLNKSKGCGTVMRVAPVGILFRHNRAIAFREGLAISALTHGHPSGYLSGGFLSSVFADLVNGIDFETAIHNAIYILTCWPESGEVYSALLNTVDLHRDLKGRELTPEHIKKLGEGWVAEEALAIALLCALHYPNDFEKGVLAAVNHSGDSDSTGAITGNLLGLMNGAQRIPAHFKENLLHREIVEAMAQDLCTECKSDSFNTDRRWWDRYPGF